MAVRARGRTSDNSLTKRPRRALQVEVGSDHRVSLKYRYLLASCAAVIIASAATAWITWQVAVRNPPTLNVREPPDPEEPLPPSPSYLHEFRRAAVCTDGTPCSRIGRDILSKNGSAVDAAVAALFCNGVVNMQSMGLGGGFIMTIYDRNSQKAHSLIARESAPKAAHRDMFVHNITFARDGALATGVPGELRGYWEAHKKFGKLPWADVVQPSVQLCYDGYHMTKHQSDTLTFRPYLIKSDVNLREWFVDKTTGRMMPIGSLIRPLRLCRTLQVIAAEGGEALNNGSLTRTLVEDIKAHGGIITEDDLRNYKPEWREPVSVKLRDSTLFSAPPPGGGALVAFILKILEGYNITQDSLNGLENTTTTIHRMLEAFKYASARRTLLGDPNFVNITEELNRLTSDKDAAEIRALIRDNETSNRPDHYGAVSYNTPDHGTAHISILAPNGDAVSVTSSVNLYYGAGITSERTGIILNSGMDDFSLPGTKNYFGLPPTPANYIVPGKISLSSFSPTMITDSDGNIKMVIGASGGTKIITSISYMILRYLWLGESLKQAVDASRLHHQLYPMEVSYEYGVLAPIIHNLQKLGHKTVRYRERGSIICVVSKRNDTIYANADYRKGGEVYGID